MNISPGDTVMIGGKKQRVLLSMNGWVSVIDSGAKHESFRAAMDASKRVRTGAVEMVGGRSREQPG